MYRKGGGQGFKHMYDADDSGRTRTPDLDAAAASPTPDLDAAAAAAALHPSFNCRPGSAFAPTSLAFPDPEWIMMLPSPPRCSGPTDPLHLNIDDVEQLDQRNLPLFTPRLSTPMSSPVPEFPCILSPIPAPPIPAPIMSPLPQSNDLTQTAPPQKNPPQKNQAEQQAFYCGLLLHAMESLPQRQPGEKKPDFNRNLQQHVLKEAHAISERHNLPSDRFSTLFNDLWGIARTRTKEGKKGGCGGGRKKSAQMNTRNNFQDFQRAVMEAAFKNNRYPSQKEKARLAQEFGVELKQVHTWFQNRRTKLAKDRKANIVDFALTQGTRKQQHMVADLVTSPVVVTATATATTATATTTAVVVTAATTTAIAVVTPRYSSSGGVVPVVLPLRPTPIPPPPAAVNSNASDSGLDSAGSSASISGFFNQQMLMQQMEQQIRQDCYFTRNSVAGAAAPYAAPYYSPPLASFFPQHHQPRQQHHQPPPQHHQPPPQHQHHLF